MARLLALLCLVASCGALRIGAPAAHAPARCSSIVAQMAPAPLKTRQKVNTGDPGSGGGKGGGGSPAAAIAKPKRKAHVEDVPLWKVILLGDEEYEEDPVRARQKKTHGARSAIVVAHRLACAYAGLHCAQGCHP